MPRKVQRTHHLLCTALVSLAASSSSSAQDSNPLDCNVDIKADGTQYNIASLAGEHSVARNRSTPPTTMQDELRFDICQDLTHRGNTPSDEECPTGTRACLTKTNQKSGADDRVIAVIPVAQTSTLEPSYSALTSPAGLSITLRGPNYPLSASPSIPQSLNLTILCTSEENSDPTFVGYENGIVSVEWKTGAGCAKSDDGSSGDGGNSGGGDGEKNAEGHSTGGSGIGWFFLLLFFSFTGYFALGAYYNYNDYGATGWDLIPHRDFWRDLPYLMQDFGEHLCSTLRPGRQGGYRRGYHAV